MGLCYFPRLLNPPIEPSASCSNNGAELLETGNVNISSTESNGLPLVKTDMHPKP